MGLSSFGYEMSKCLEEEGLSQAQFAKSIECPQPYVNRVLRGLRPPPLGRIDQWVGGVKVSEKRRRRLLLLAALANSPESVKQHVEWLEERVRVLEDRSVT